ncbi:hypothetical protein [Flexivirga alba]|uniref:Uncharacterized protein n=1 Tax=Flexivirga alba TaxID=702742 RepID=A0ABW2AGT0_9MICO
MSAVLIESRSARWIAEIGVLMAAAAAAPVWIADSADIVWRAAQIDPEQIVLA